MACIQKRGDAWRAIVKHKGEVRTGTFDTKVESSLWAAQQLLEMKSEAEAKALTPSGMLHDLFDRYTKDVSPTKRGARWEKIRINKFKREVANKPLDKVTEADIEAWRDAKVGRLKNESIRREMNIMSDIFTKAKEWRLIRTDPTLGVKRPSPGKPRTQTFSDADLKKTLEALGWAGDAVPSNGRQQTAVALLLALETGARFGELWKLRVADINLKQRTAILRVTKNEDDREIPLTPRAVELIKLLIPLGKETLFTISAGTGSQYAMKACAGDMHFHDSRRTALSKLAKKIKNPLDLAKISGHRDLKILLNTYYSVKASDLAKLLS